MDGFEPFEPLFTGHDPLNIADHVRTIEPILAALDADAVDVLQPDVVLAVGMLRTRTIAELALLRHPTRAGIHLILSAHLRGACQAHLWSAGGASLCRDASAQHSDHPDR